MAASPNVLKSKQPKNVTIVSMSIEMKRKSPKKLFKENEKGWKAEGELQ